MVIEDAHQIIVSGVERAAGTLLGAVVAISILGISSDPIISLLVFLLALFLLFSFQRVNYAIFVFFMTLMLMSTIAIGGSDVTTGGIERFLAVMSGVALAFLGIGIFIYTNYIISLVKRLKVFESLQGFYSGKKRRAKKWCGIL